MITEDYCSFEVAKLLKEKGFDEPCRAYWDDQPKLDVHTLFFSAEPIKNSERAGNDISCPTHQMAMKWLRKKGVYMSIDTVVSSSGNIYFNIDTYSEESGWNHPVNFYENYEEAVDVDSNTHLKT